MRYLWVLLLNGCALFGGLQTNATPEQIAANAKDKNASALCIAGPTPWGASKVVALGLDKSAIASGGVAVKGNCDEVSITAEPKPLKPETKP